MIIQTSFFLLPAGGRLTFRVQLDVDTSSEFVVEMLTLLSGHTWVQLNLCCGLCSFSVGLNLRHGGHNSPAGPHPGLSHFRGSDKVPAPPESSVRSDPSQPSGSCRQNQNCGPHGPAVPSWRGQGGGRGDPEEVEIQPAGWWHSEGLTHNQWFLFMNHLHRVSDLWPQTCLNKKTLCGNVLSSVYFFKNLTKHQKHTDQWTLQKTGRRGLYLEITCSKTQRNSLTFSLKKGSRSFGFHGPSPAFMTIGRL